jgi:hypothetical protein
MKLAMLAMVGTLLVTLSACQSDMTGPAAAPDYSNTPLVAPPGDNHPDVPAGDIYFEEMIGRY